MGIEYYQIDSFTDQLYSGNPAGVCLLKAPISEKSMQQIAFENGLSETAFVWQQDAHFHIRWFTPVTEVDLCGHATLAAGHVLLREHPTDQCSIFFQSRSGPLTVSCTDDRLEMDFPIDIPTSCEPPVRLIEAMGLDPVEVLKGKTDFLLIYHNEADITDLAPDFRILKDIDARGVIASAPGKQVDVVSRFFAPQCGVNEDPVTGSAHTTLTPYWCSKLNITTIRARQLSSRGGSLLCRMEGDRVYVRGDAVTHLKGWIAVPH